MGASRFARRSLGVGPDAMPEQTRRQNTRVIEHQELVAAEQLWQIRELAIFDISTFAIEEQQT
jgi:hypothetical protein